MILRRLIAALLVLTGGSLAQAQPVLRSSTAERATITRITDLRLDFDRPIGTKAARVDLVMTSMPGMRGHHEMRVTTKAMPSKDGSGLQLTTMTPLPAGGYKLEWQAKDRQGGSAGGR